MLFHASVYTYSSCTVFCPAECSLFAKGLHGQFLIANYHPPAHLEFGMNTVQEIFTYLDVFVYRVTKNRSTFTYTRLCFSHYLEKYYLWQYDVTLSLVWTHCKTTGKKLEYCLTIQVN